MGFRKIIDNISEPSELKNSLGKVNSTSVLTIAHKRIQLKLEEGESKFGRTVFCK